MAIVPLDNDDLETIVGRASRFVLVPVASRCTTASVGVHSKASLSRQSVVVHGFVDIVFAEWAISVQYEGNKLELVPLILKQSLSLDKD